MSETYEEKIERIRKVWPQNAQEQAELSMYERDKAREELAAEKASHASMEKAQKIIIESWQSMHQKSAASAAGHAQAYLQQCTKRIELEKEVDALRELVADFIAGKRNPEEFTMRGDEVMRRVPVRPEEPK